MSDEEKAETMPGLSRKETERLLDHIENQGVGITKIKNGVMLRMPDGESTVVHYSVSDHRGPQKLKAKLKRSGITWPTDPGQHRSKGRPSKRTIEAGFAALASLGWPASLTTREAVMAWPYADAERDAALRGNKMTQQRFLTWAGFDLRGRGSASRWVRLDDEARPETFPPAERHAVLSWSDSAADARIEIVDGPAPDLTIDPGDQIEPVKAAARAAALPRETVAAPAEREPAEIVPISPPAEPDAAEPDAAEPIEPDAAEREPATWAAWKDLPGDWTIDQVRLMLMAFGLDGELRVWRAP